MTDQTTTLNERIARALGWRWEKQRYANQDQYHQWVFYAPSGKEHLTERLNLGLDEAMAEVMPDWEHDLNEAVALPHDGWQLRLFSPGDDEPDDWEALFTQPDVVGYRAFGATPAASRRALDGGGEPLVVR